MNLLLQYDPIESGPANFLSQSNLQSQSEFEMQTMEDILMEAGLTTSSHNISDGNSLFSFDIDAQGSHSMMCTSDSSNSDPIQSLAMPTHPPNPADVDNSCNQTIKKQPKKRSSINKNKKTVKSRISDSEMSALDNTKTDSSVEGNDNTGSIKNGCVVWKRCQVCEDRAVNHNFGQLTCESCKAFFRRNAHKKMKLKCASGDDNCEITSETRKQCPSCRLNKCFLIGMRSDLIQIRKNGNKPRWNGTNPSRPNSSSKSNLNQTQSLPIGVNAPNYGNSLPPIMPKLLPGEPSLSCAFAGDLLVSNESPNNDFTHADAHDANSAFTTNCIANDASCLVPSSSTYQREQDLGSICLNSGIVQQSFYSQQLYFNPHIQQLENSIPVESNHHLFSDANVIPHYTVCTTNSDNNTNYTTTNHHYLSNESNVAFWLDEWPSTLSTSSANQDEGGSLSSLFTVDQTSGGHSQMTFSLSGEQSDIQGTSNLCQTYDINGADLLNSTTAGTISPISTPGQLNKENNCYMWKSGDDISINGSLFSTNHSNVGPHEALTVCTPANHIQQNNSSNHCEPEPQANYNQAVYPAPVSVIGPEMGLAGTVCNGDSSAGVLWAVDSGGEKCSDKFNIKSEAGKCKEVSESVPQQQSTKLATFPMRHPPLGPSPRIIQLEWAWAATWSNGSFSNPAGVQLRLDTTADPEWPLICINMADIFLRKLLLMIKRIPEVQKLEPQLQTNLARVRLLTTIPVLFASCLLNPEEVGGEQIPGVDQVVRFLVTTTREEVLLDLSKLGAAISKLNPAKYSILQHLGVYCRNLAQLLDRRPALFALYLLIKLFDTSPTKLEETVSTPNSTTTSTHTNFLFQSSSSSTSPSISPALSSPGNLSSFNLTNSPLNGKPPSMTSPLPTSIGKHSCSKPPNFSNIQAEYVDLFCESIRHYSLSDESSRLKTLKELLTWSVQFDKCFQAFFRDTAANYPHLATQIVSEFSINSA